MSEFRQNVSDFRQSLELLEEDDNPDNVSKVSLRLRFKSIISNELDCISIREIPSLEEDKRRWKLLL